MFKKSQKIPAFCKTVWSCAGKVIARVNFVTQPVSNLGNHLVDGNLLAGHGLIIAGYLAKEELTASFEIPEKVFSKSRRC
jgi:hypothetical protein